MFKILDFILFSESYTISLTFGDPAQCFVGNDHAGILIKYFHLVPTFNLEVVSRNSRKH